MKYQSHKGWTSNSNVTTGKLGNALYQSHKGWTSNLGMAIDSAASNEYQSHKGWTSNMVLHMLLHARFHCINPTRGGRQTVYKNKLLETLMLVSIPQGVDVKLPFLVGNDNDLYCINPTRGGRQTVSWAPACSSSWCINPTRGGRQT